MIDTSIHSTYLLSKMHRRGRFKYATHSRTYLKILDACCRTVSSCQAPSTFDRYHGCHALTYLIVKFSTPDVEYVSLCQLFGITTSTGAVAEWWRAPPRAREGARNQKPAVYFYRCCDCHWMNDIYLCLNTHSTKPTEISGPAPTVYLLIDLFQVGADTHFTNLRTKNCRLLCCSHLRNTNWTNHHRQQKGRARGHT
jgi:hypothetical protein